MNHTGSHKAVKIDTAFVGLFTPFVCHKEPDDAPIIGLFSPIVGKTAFLGFTLIEMVVVLMIAGILGAIAVPAINQFVQANNLTTVTNEFLADLKLARSEAVKRSVPAIMCESATGTACSSTGNWNTGWMVFSDTDNNGAWNLSAGAEDIMIRRHATIPALNVITASTGSTTTVSFLSQGAVTGSQQYVVCNTKIRKSRIVTIGSTGQITIAEGSC